MGLGVGIEEGALCVGAGLIVGAATYLVFGSLFSEAFRIAGIPKPSATIITIKIIAIAIFWTLEILVSSSP